MNLILEVEGFGTQVAFQGGARDWAVANVSTLSLYRDGRERARLAAPGKIFALQPDGERLLAAPHLYANGRFVPLPPAAGADYEVRAAAWSPDREDLLLAVRYLAGEDDGGADEPASERLLRVRGREPAQVLVEGEWEYRALHVSARWLAAATSRVSVWGRASGVRRDFGGVELHAVRALAGDDWSLFAVDAAGLAADWDAQTGVLRRSWQAHEGDVWGLAHHPGRALLATSGSDGALRLWSVNGAPRLLHEQRLDGVARALAFDAAGDHLLAAVHGRRPRLMLFETP